MLISNKVRWLVTFSMLTLAWYYFDYLPMQSENERAVADSALLKMQIAQIKKSVSVMERQKIYRSSATFVDEGTVFKNIYQYVAHHDAMALVSMVVLSSRKHCKLEIKIKGRYAQLRTMLMRMAWNKMTVDIKKIVLSKIRNSYVLLTLNAVLLGCHHDA